EELAVLVPQGGDDDVRPEVRAVLAHAPALLLVASVALGDAQLLGGVVAGDVRLGVEGREVLADDLLVGVALQPPRAGVPGQDVAVAVEQEDRVVDHRLDEQAELVGALLVSWRSHARWTPAARSPRGRGRRAPGTAAGRARIRRRRACR